ncbi:RidA family protein [Fulvivirgaceae bacterium LMO-SS25]
MKTIHSPNAPEAIGPYAQAIVVNGFVYCSGQTPLLPETMQLIADDIETQTKQALENLKVVLEQAGSGLDKVVKTTVFLKNFRDFPKMNAVYANVFGSHRPARSTVEVSRLPMDALVEIECVAVI